MGCDILRNHISEVDPVSYGAELQPVSHGIAMYIISVGRKNAYPSGCVKHSSELQPILWLIIYNVHMNPSHDDSSKVDH